MARHLQITQGVVEEFVQGVHRRPRGDVKTLGLPRPRAGAGDYGPLC